MTACRRWCRVGCPARPSSPAPLRPPPRAGEDLRVATPNPLPRGSHRRPDGIRSGVGPARLTAMRLVAIIGPMDREREAGDDWREERAEESAAVTGHLFG